MNKSTSINIFFLLFFFSATSVFAQGKMILLKGEHKQKLNFELVNNLIVIPVEVNGKLLSFIFDSGATNTIIFGATEIDSLTLKNKEKIVLYGLGSKKATEGLLSKNNQIRIKNIWGTNQNIYVIPNENFRLSNLMGKTIHGIIGYTLFKDFVVKINYSRKYLKFYKPKQFKAPRSKRYKDFPLTVIRKKVYLKSKISLTDSTEQDVNLLIDTGNSDALWLFENKKKAITPKGKFFIDYLGEGLSGPIIGKRNKIKSFSIGNYKFINPTTAFIDSTSTLNARSYSYRNGSIGGLVLQRFNTIIDYPNKKIYLKKTRSFKKEFRYNRAGIELEYAGETIVKSEKMMSRRSINENSKSGGINTGITFNFVTKFHFEPIYAIKNIRPNSAASKAGLQVGDIISKIKGKEAYHYKLSELINLFYGKEGAEIPIIVARKGFKIDTKLVLEKPI